MIRELYYRWKLKNQKRRALHEVNQDLLYIKTFKQEALQCDEGPLRHNMSMLKKKEDKTPEEEKTYEAILDTIAESKAVKNEFQKTSELAKDIENYISLL